MQVLNRNRQRLLLLKRVQTLSNTMGKALEVASVHHSSLTFDSRYDEQQRAQKSSFFFISEALDNNGKQHFGFRVKKQTPLLFSPEEVSYF